jgi:hypothetical protein
MCLSFESVSQPGRFLRQQAARMRIDPNDNSAAFRADATFCPRAALDGGSGFSLESKALPGNYVRHANAQLWLHAFQDTGLFRGDATWAPVTGWWSSSIVQSLQVADTANAGAWSVQQNLQVNNTSYGDRAYTFSAVPAEVAGSTWIRTANSSKNSNANPLVTFSLAADADVYVALDNRTGRPGWVDGSWSDTGADLTQAESATVSVGFSLYRKRFNAGQVSLGAWGNGGSMYTVIVK